AGASDAATCSTGTSVGRSCALDRTAPGQPAGPSEPDLETPAAHVGSGVSDAGSTWAAGSCVGSGGGSGSDMAASPGRGGAALRPGFRPIFRRARSRAGLPDQTPERNAVPMSG